MRFFGWRMADMARSRRVLAALRASPQGWWWIFGLLIAAPALVLSLLGLRAVRLDEVDRGQQAGEHQRQIALLADASLGNALQSLERDLQRFEIAALDQNPRGLRLMAYERPGYLLFPRERVFFADDLARPKSTLPPPRADAVEAEIEAAQAVEAQRQPARALPLLRHIASREPALADWARFQSARIRFEGGDLGALVLLADAGWSGSAGLTPGHLPVAFLACDLSRGVPAPERRRFVPLLAQTLDALRAGRWWLAFDEREFYDGELRSLMAAAGQPRVANDPVLEDLATVRDVVRDSPPGRRHTVTRSIERARGRAFLLLWAPDPNAPERWMGLTASPVDRVIEPAVRPLLSSAAEGAVLLDARGDTLWNSRGAPFTPARLESLPVVPGWALGFSEPTGSGTFGQRRQLWYALVGLLMVMLLAGTTMTVRTVRRELALARLQSDFVAAVSHEFKSPLTSIGLHMERLLGGRVADPDLRDEYYRTVSQDAERLQRLVDRLLDSQQIQAGSKTYVFEPGSIAAAAGAAVARLRPLADAKQIRVEISDDGQPHEASFDRAAITDAIDNLVENAIKYSPPGESIAVTVRTIGDDVEVDVADHGSGVDAVDLPHIFDKFYRGRRSETHDVRGTGLGLSLVKAIVEAHQGTVAVASMPGHGSRFTLRLPGAPAIGRRSDVCHAS
jgi:signal transduction histidine kinase